MQQLLLLSVSTMNTEALNKQGIVSISPSGYCMNKSTQPFDLNVYDLTSLSLPSLLSSKRTGHTRSVDTHPLTHCACVSLRRFSRWKVFFWFWVLSLLLALTVVTSHFLGGAGVGSWNCGGWCGSEEHLHPWSLHFRARLQPDSHKIWPFYFPGLP